MGVKLELALPGDAPENPDVCVAHDRPDPPSGIGIETSMAWGAAREVSSGLNSRYPTTPAGPAKRCGGCPQPGHAVRYIAAA